MPEEFGAGLQYKVYAEGLRVRKIPQDLEGALGVLASWGNFSDVNDQSNKEWAEHSVEQTVKTSEFFLDLLGQYPELSSYLGDPTIEADGGYTQDRAKILGDVLSGRTAAEAETIFEQYVDGILFGWRYGFSDIVYNFTINNGLTEDNRLILLDFGEVSDDKSLIQHHIENKVWLQRWSYNYNLAVAHKDVFYQIMGERVTIKALEQNWQAALRYKTRTSVLSHFSAHNQE